MPKAKQKTNKWLVLIIMCFLTVMLNIDATAINLAIPVIAHEYHAELSTMQWVINLFLFGAAAFQILGGRLGDIFGHRLIFNIGVSLFVFASILAGIAMAMDLLLAGRLLQGIALGLAYPMTVVIAFKVFPKRQHGLAMGIIMGVMGLSLAVGPTIGGLFVEYLNWHWIFYINVPIGIVTVLMGMRYCPPDTVGGSFKDLDKRGAVLLLIGILALVLAINQSQNWGFASVPFIASLLVGLLCLLVLYKIEHLHKEPVVEFGLFKIRDFSLYCIIRFFAQLIFLPLLFFVPIYLLNISGYSPVDAGLVLLSLTLVVGVVSPLAGVWIDKMGAKWPTAISMLLMAVGCYMLTWLQPQPNLVLLMIAFIISGIGLGIAFVSTTTGALNPVPHKSAGVASGIYFTIIWVSCAFAIAIAGTIVAIVSRSHLLNHAKSISLYLSNAQLHALIRGSRGLSPVSHLKHNILLTHIANLQGLVSQSFMSGFHAIMLLLAIFAMLGLILSLLARSSS